MQHHDRPRFLKTQLAALALAMAPCPNLLSGEASPPPDSRNDPYLWLEEVTGEKSLAWVRAQNEISQEELEARPEFEKIRTRLLEILDSKERIPSVTKHGRHLYNFWRDDRNPRGLLRRTSMVEYRKPTPEWEVVLDLDALGTAENENWVWKGYSVLYPSNDRCLTFLSRGGADATVTREFDLEKKAFVPDGFRLPEAKGDVSWRNRDTLYVATDFGPGSLTSSGYPRIVKEWRRGAPLSEAHTLFVGEETDVWCGASVVHDHGHTYEFLFRATSFYSNKTWLRREDAWMPIEKPDDAEIDTFNDQLLVTLRSPWEVDGTTYLAGALLAADLDDYLAGNRVFSVLFEPTDRKSMAGTSATKSYLILNELENVRNRLYLLRRGDGAWRREPLPAPALGTIGARGVDPHESDEYWMTVTDFLTPSSLYLGEAGGHAPEQLKTLPAFFNTEGLRIDQFETPSADGTRIPYFQVSRKDLSLDGANPTLLYGYGGFEIPILSRYSATVGSAWLETGGVYVVANIRGGGEFGPRWHQAALKENRQRAYDDFIAVAEDLIRRKVTSPRHLGIRGGSNGGLLMGNMLVQRPDLFRAIVCQVPLLDMKRYNKLLAGASWMGEYGNPDVPEEWAYLQRYSPYQLVKPRGDYPRVLFTTSTRDDRVHPGHARKMVAKMKAQGHDVLYYENIEGGHGGAANNKQRAYMTALAYTFLLHELR